MDNLETLIEAVEYGDENGTDWWDIFDSVDEAKKTLNKAAKEQADDYQVARLADILDEDIYEVSQVGAFRNCAASTANGNTSAAPSAPACAEVTKLVPSFWPSRATPTAAVSQNSDPRGADR